MENKKTTKKTKKVINKTIKELPTMPAISVKKTSDFIELKNKVIKKINHPNRQIIAIKLLDGVPESELIEEFGKVKVAEIKRIISACKGKPWVCTHCG